MTTAQTRHPLDWARQVRVLREGLDHLLATSDRSDPVEETVIGMFESALHAATAAGRTREPCPADARAAMRDMLAAARAAVVTASFALAETPPPRSSTLRAVPDERAAIGRQVARDQRDPATGAPTVGCHD